MAGGVAASKGGGSPPNAEAYCCHIVTKSAAMTGTTRRPAGPKKTRPPSVPRITRQIRKPAPFPQHPLCADRRGFRFLDRLGDLIANLLAGCPALAHVILSWPGPWAK